MQRVRYRSFDGDHWGEVVGGTVHQLAALMGRRTGVTAPLTDVSLLAPCEPRAIVCVGKNYADHVREMGGDEALPLEPGLFLKAPNAVSAPGDPIPYPGWTEELHYEGELAVVIGRTLRRADRDDALDAVLGYTCAIDVTARDAQRGDLQWIRAKSADGFCPLGPWLETDLDPAELELTTRVNGERRQHAATRDLIFDVPTILAHVSEFMTLQPGDVVLTGTPEGVGPLRPGDEVEVEIAGIGTLSALVERA